MTRLKPGNPLEDRLRSRDAGILQISLHCDQIDFRPITEEWQEQAQITSDSEESIRTGEYQLLRGKMIRPRLQQPRLVIVQNHGKRAMQALCKCVTFSGIQLGEKLRGRCTRTAIRIANQQVCSANDADFGTVVDEWFERFVA